LKQVDKLCFSCISLHYSDPRY